MVHVCADETMWSGGGTAALILCLGTRLRQVVSHKPQLLHPL